MENNDENFKKNFLNNITLIHKHCRFNEKITIYFYEKSKEPSGLTAGQRSADQERLARIIEPILEKTHRVKISARNFCVQDPDTTISPVFNMKQQLST